jgi:hypothetical protein
MRFARALAKTNFRVKDKPARTGVHEIHINAKRQQVLYSLTGRNVVANAGIHGKLFAYCRELLLNESDPAIVQKRNSYKCALKTTKALKPAQLRGVCACHKAL